MNNTQKQIMYLCLVWLHCTKKPS